jgi:mannose-6-phosphate isomerase-like protein (cupin superfamily)
VSSAGWTVASLSDLTRVPGREDIEWLPLQHALRLSAFGTNVFVGPEGGEELIGLHDESSEDGQEELYVVLAGTVRFEIDGEALELRREDVIAVRDRGVRRRATGLEPGSSVLVIGAPPGSSKRSTWRPEWFADVPRLGDGDQRHRPD